jgi:hypothetical protein
MLDHARLDAATGIRLWQLRVHAGRDSITGRMRSVERTFRGNKRQASKALATLVTETEQRAPGSAKEGTVSARPTQLAPTVARLQGASKSVVGHVLLLVVSGGFVQWGQVLVPVR